MADTRKTKDRCLRSCQEVSRLEEQLWSMAYEQIWPVVRKRQLRRQQPAKVRTAFKIPVARRA